MRNMSIMHPGLCCKKIGLKPAAAFPVFFDEWLEQSSAPGGERAARLPMPAASGLGREEKANPSLQ